MKFGSIDDSAGGQRFIPFEVERKIVFSIGKPRDAFSSSISSGLTGDFIQSGTKLWQA